MTNIRHECVECRQVVALGDAYFYNFTTGVYRHRACGLDTGRTLEELVSPAPRAQHTPGPWEQVGNAISGPDRWIALMTTADGKTSSVLGDSVAYANARLIAVAPTAPHDCTDLSCPGALNKRRLDTYDALLEALQMCIEAPITARELAIARAAIAAATGGQP